MKFRTRLKSALLLITPPLALNKYSEFRSNPRRFHKKNVSALLGFRYQFKVHEFRYIDTTDSYDLKWGWWSRIYEYELVLRVLNQLQLSNASKVHNTCWGYHGCHILFKNELESLGCEIINSDLLESKVDNTTIYDLRKSVPAEYEDSFDFVLNVSTIEEIDAPHLEIVSRLMSMVKVGGYLVVTFDIPGMQLYFLEQLFGTKIQGTKSPLNGSNSPYRMDEFQNLQVGYFVVERTL